MGYDLMRFVGEVDEEFQCSICSMVFENPVETPCDHAFCNECITRWLSNEAVCPIDRTPLSLSELERPRRVFRSLMAKLNIKCDYELEGCDVTVDLEHLETHLINCEYNPNRRFICVKGCNSEMHRHEVPTHNCVEYLSKLVSIKDVEITDLTSALNDQKEECRRLTCELNHRNEELINLRLSVIDRDAQITHLKETEQKLRAAAAVKSQKWKIVKNLHLYEESNILEFIGTADRAYERGHAQSNYHLRTGSSAFKVEVLSRSGFVRIGLATETDQSLSSRSAPKYFSSYGNVDFYETFHYNQENWNIGDIIECGIENAQHLDGNEKLEMFVYFSKNGKLLTAAESVNMRPDRLFPTISLSGLGTRVRVLS